MRYDDLESMYMCVYILNQIHIKYINVLCFYKLCIFCYQVLTINKKLN